MSSITNNGSVIPEQSRAALYTKVAMRILPVLIACYFLAYLDRINIGYAKLQMLHDIGMSDAAYGFGAGLFFIGYLLFEVPSNMLMMKIGAKKTICRIMVLWGLISLCFAFVDKPWQFYLLRVLLGAAEAGFYPGVILYLTFWFPSHVRGKITAIFFAAVPLSGMFGAPLSGTIIEKMHLAFGMSGWQWLFILESIPSILLGICIPRLLTNNVSEASWLSDGERVAIQEDLEKERQYKESIKSQAKKVSGIFTNRMVWYLIIICICQTFAMNGIGFWLPTLIKGFGVNNIEVIGWLSAIPYLCATVTLIVIGRSSDRWKERKFHTAIPFLLVSAGLIGSIFFQDNIVTAIICLSIATAGAFTVAGLYWTLPSMFLSGLKMAAAIAFINSMGGLGGFIGPSIIGMVKDSTGSSTGGVIFIACISILGAILVLFLPKKIINR